jgi:hypothetical protein
MSWLLVDCITQANMIDANAFDVELLCITGRQLTRPGQNTNDIHQTASSCKCWDHIHVIFVDLYVMLNKPMQFIYQVVVFFFFYYLLRT